MIPKQILLITPGLKNSRGHEIHGYAIQKSLEKFTKVKANSSSSPISTIARHRSSPKKKQVHGQRQKTELNIIRFRSAG